MNCLFCHKSLTRENPLSGKRAYCINCRDHPRYKFYDQMILEECYEISFSTGYYPGYYMAYLHLWSNTIIVHSYIWDDNEKTDKAHLFYEGKLPNDITPQNSKKFIQRLLDLKAFL